MKKTKIFDSKKSPYKQMLKHKGPMILFAEKLDGELDRIRYLDGRGVRYSEYRLSFRTRETTFKDFRSSCYSQIWQSREKNILAMKQYDRGWLKISHIDFY